MAKDFNLDDWTGAYGPNWETGVLVDRVADAMAAGAVIRIPRHGKATFITGPNGGRAERVVCGDIIEIWTEDGKIDGRCGLDVPDGKFACEGHAAAYEAWAGMSELEKIELERNEEMAW